MMVKKHELAVFWYKRPIKTPLNVNEVLNILQELEYVQWRAVFRQ